MTIYSFLFEWLVIDIYFLLSQSEARQVASFGSNSLNYTNTPTTKSLKLPPKASKLGIHQFLS